MVPVALGQHTSPIASLILVGTAVVFVGCSPADPAPPELPPSLPHASCTATGGWDLHPENDHVDQFRILSFDDLGNLLHMEYKTRLEGAATEVWEVRNGYNNLGKLVSLDADYRSNLLPIASSWSFAYEYNDRGQEVLSEHDDRSDGTVDETAWRSYDGELLEGERYDRDGDLQVDEAITYAHEAGSGTVIAEIDGDGDGSIDRRWTRHYDDRGLVQVEEFDADLDGVSDFRADHSWNSRDLRVLLESDVDGDGEIDLSESWEHGDRSLVVRYELDNDADGTIDETTTYDWDCP